MSSWIPSVQWRTTAGRPTNTASGNVTPISWALLVRFPFGGFVWNQPIAVELEQGGQVQRVPIVDITKIAILVMAGIGLIVSVGALLSAFSHLSKSVSGG